MINLKTNYMGLELKNPIIVSSSGLTSSINKIKKMEEFGAGAIVLKSLFEEQINYETGTLLEGNDYPEAEDYIRTYSKNNSVVEYINLIKEAKKAVSIPIIASINCISANDWTDFAKEIEEAGADAIELNIFILPSDKEDSFSYEKRYFEIVKKVKEQTSLPIAVKIGSHFTNLIQFTEQLSAVGADAIVLFNRFYEPDIDIDNMKFCSAEIFSSPSDIRHSLRWVGLISGKLPKIQISASTGIHDAKGVAKQLLAGAITAQICSTLYNHSLEEIRTIISELEKWMIGKGYNSINDFRGKFSSEKQKDASIYQRSQFMKYFSSVV